MKIALCLTGYVGSLEKFNHQNSSEQIHIGEAFEYYKKNVIQDYDVDIFIHSWDINRKEEILEIYKPCSHIIEPQKEQFKIDHTLFEGMQRDIVFGCQSQKYSRMKAIELKKKYEKENNFEYDFVFLSRFDIAFMKPFNYDELDNANTYCPDSIRGEQIQDFYYLTNSKKMNVIGEFYNHMEECGLGKGNFDIHNIEWNYFFKLKEKELHPVQTFYIRPWGAPQWVGDVRLLRSKPNIKMKIHSPPDLEDKAFLDVNLKEKETQEYNSEIVEDWSKVLLRIETTNNCNMRCSFCPHPTMVRPKGFMDSELLYSIIDQASEMGFVKLDLRNFGEPLLDKRLGEFAKYAVDRGLNKIYIHTNGLGITEKKLKKWGEGGITDVNISLSPKREYSESRPGTKVDKVFSNLEKVMKSDSPWKDILSVDYIRTGLSTEKEEKEFFDWLKEYNLVKRIDIELHNWAEGDSDYHKQCHRLWTSVTILWDGRVSLCCLDYEGDIEFGDLKNSSLKDIVNNQNYQFVRKQHINGKFLSKCKKCDMVKIKDEGTKPSYVKIG